MACNLALVCTPCSALFTLVTLLLSMDVVPNITLETIIIKGLQITQSVIEVNLSLGLIKGLNDKPMF